MGHMKCEIPLSKSMCLILEFLKFNAFWHARNSSTFFAFDYISILFECDQEKVADCEMWKKEKIDIVIEISSNFKVVTTTILLMYITKN